jgi:hypothetical protein
MLLLLAVLRLLLIMLLWARIEQVCWLVGCGTAATNAAAVLEAGPLGHWSCQAGSLWRPGWQVYYACAAAAAASPAAASRYGRHCYKPACMLLLPCRPCRCRLC